MYVIMYALTLWHTVHYRRKGIPSGVAFHTVDMQYISKGDKKRKNPFRWNIGMAQ